MTDQAEVIAPDMKSVGDKFVTVRYTYTDDGGNEQTAETKFAIKVNPAPADEEERPTDPNQTPPQEDGAVQTGDTTDILPTAAACILAFAAAAAIAALKRRKRF